MKTPIRRIGNSRGILLPKPLLSQLNFGAEVDLEIEQDAIILRKPRNRVREGWAEASKQLAERGNHRSVWPELAMKGDAKLRW